MIQGGLNQAPQTQPGMLTGDDMSSVPLVQLNQLVQQGNPGVKAAAILELAKRSSSGGGRPVGMGGSGSPGLAPVVAAGADAMPGMQPVQSGITASSENAPAPQSAPPAPVQSARNPMAPSPPSNPALDAISTGAGAAAGVTNATPSATDSGQAFPLTTPGQNPGLSVLGGQADTGDSNPGIASIGSMAPSTDQGPPTFDIHPDVTTADKLRALSKGFFTLASSKQPGFLGAVGEGGNAAADALQAAQDRAQQGAEFGVQSSQVQQQIDDRAAERQDKIAQQQQQLLAIRQAVSRLPKDQQALAMADPEGFFGAEFKSMFDKGSVPSSIQEFEYAVKNGYKGTPAQFWTDQKRASSGSSNVNINMPKSINAGDEELMKTGADAYQQAQEIIPLFGIAKQSAMNFPNTGPLGKGALLVERGKQMLGLPNTASSGEVLQGMQTRLGTLMRVPGSGATSDMEMSLYMQGVPSLMNTQQGNIALADIGQKLMQRRMENYRAMQNYIASHGSSVGYAPNDTPVLTPKEINMLQQAPADTGDTGGSEAPPTTVAPSVPPAGTPAGAKWSPVYNAWVVPDKNSKSGWSKVVTP